MKIIKVMSEDIERELDIAEDCARKSVQYKTEFPDVARIYDNLCTTHLNCIKSLHDQVVSIINKYKIEKGEPPAPMMAIYEYLHERQISKTVAVRNLQEIYKQM